MRIQVVPMLTIAAVLAGCSLEAPAPSATPAAEPTLPAAMFVWRAPPAVTDVLVAQPEPELPTGVTTEQITIKSYSLIGAVTRIATIPVGQLPGREPEMLFGHVAISSAGFVSVAYDHDGQASVRIYDPHRPSTPIAILDANPGSWGPTGLYAAEQQSIADAPGAPAHRLIVFDPSNDSTHTLSLPVDLNLDGNLGWTPDGTGMLAYRIDGHGGIAASAIVLVQDGHIVLAPATQARATLLGQSVGGDGSRLTLDASRTAGGPPPRLLTLPAAAGDEATVWYDGASDDWSPRWYGWDTDGSGLLFLAERNGQVTLERHDAPDAREVLGVVPLRDAVDVTVEGIGRDGNAGEIVAVLRYRFAAQLSSPESLFLYRTLDDSMLPLAESGQLVDAQLTFLGFRPTN
jgi:hypothetical protein